MMLKQSIQIYPHRLSRFLIPIPIGNRSRLKSGQGSQRKSNIILISISVLLTLMIILPRTGFTQERLSVTDKEIVERLTRLEEGQKALNQRIDDVNKRIDDVNKRIDDLQSIMLWGFGILFAMIIALFGYIVWDRKTALSSVVKETKTIIEKFNLLVEALKAYSRKEPKLAEVFRSFGL